MSKLPPISFLYERVGRDLRRMIEDQVLAEGERMPSLRRMSQQASVSLSTVVHAYAQLERQGLIESRPKSGFFVRRRPESKVGVPNPGKPHLSPRRVRVRDHQTATFAAVRAPGLTAFCVAVPAPELLPGLALKRSMARVSRGKSDPGLAYQEVAGLPELRRQIARRMAEIGSPVSVEDLLITNGATEALTIALLSVARPGDVIAVESPAYHAVLRLIERLGLLALEVQTDPTTGISLDGLRDAMNRVDLRAVLAVPNFGNPLGSLMPAGRKRVLVEMLAERQIAFIEDDIYGDLHFGDRRPGLSRCHDRDGWVLTCSSFSKTLAPGYRVGWLAAGRFQDSARAWKQSLSLGSASLPQLALTEFLADGGYERHLRRLRMACREQVARTRAAIAEYFPPGTRISAPRGGLVLWVELAAGANTDELLQRALAEQISFIPGSLFSPTGKFRNYLRIACGQPWSRARDAALRRLGHLVSIS